MATSLGRRGSHWAASIVLLALLLVPTRAETLSRKLLQTTNSGVFPWFGVPPARKSAPSESGMGTASMADAGASAPSPGAAPAGNATECPVITLRLNSIEVYDNVISRPGAQISVQCYLKDGSSFPAITFPSDSDVVRSASGARYRPGQTVGMLSCGEAVSCTAASATLAADGVATPALTWTVLADGGCWFDYRHFTQLSYQEPLSAWTCTKPPVRYTLECAECSDPAFPWETALALAGPPLSEEDTVDTGSTTLNSVMVIISVSVVAGAVVLVVTALLMRTRRRAGEEAARMTELVSRARADGASRRRRTPVKPPGLFIVGDPTDAPPPEGYRGPIVVLHCGEGDEGEAVRGQLGRSDSGVLLRWPQIAIARPEGPAEAEDAGGEGSGGEGSGAPARQRSDSDSDASGSSTAAAVTAAGADDQRPRPSDGAV